MKLGKVVNFDLYFHKKIKNPEKTMKKGENTLILFRPTLVACVTLDPLRGLIPVCMYFRKELVSMNGTTYHTKLYISHNYTCTLLMQQK